MVVTMVTPFVTHTITKEVLRLSRWKADLYLGDVNELITELSMTKCNDAVRELAGDEHEAYRAILKSLRTLLNNTLEVLDAKLHDAEVPKKEHRTSTNFGHHFTRVTNRCTNVAWA